MSITINCMNDIMKYYELYKGSGTPKYPELWSFKDFTLATGQCGKFKPFVSHIKIIILEPCYSRSHLFK